MKGRGRGQLPPFQKAATFLLRDSVTASATIASVTYDDPNGSGSWESWEPGGAWGSVAGGGRSVGAPDTQASGGTPPTTESELRWDEDGDTNLRHPKQLPRTLITMSELDWEDSEECATELWLHPQRRAGREGHALPLPGRGMRPQAAPETNRNARGATLTRTTTGLRPTAGRAEARAPQTGPRPAASPAQQPRAAEPTVRWKHGAPQRLPAAPPPRAAELDPERPERRERTITQPGAAASHAQPPQQLPAAPRRSLNQTQVSGFGAAPAWSDAPAPAPGAVAGHAAVRSDTPAPGSLARHPETPAPGSLARHPETPAPGSLARRAAVRSDTPAPGSLARHALPPAPAIESLRGKLESTQRILPPPPRPQAGHIPTILGTPAVSNGLGHAPSRLPPPAAARPPGAASTSVQAAAIEHLQEQLLEAMARVRVQEARAAEAEKSVVQAEEQLEAIVRTQMTESEQLREQLRLTTEQLRVSELRAVEAERRSLAPSVIARPSNMLHLAEPELTPPASKQGRANLILSGLLASTLSFGGAAYFMFYAPLQKQLVALEQQRVQDAQAQSNALTNVKAQSAAERQGLEAQNAELRSQLEAARVQALAENSAEEGRRGSRSRRASSSADDSAEQTPAGTRSARAIERRMRRARAAAPADDQPAPSRSSRSRDDSDDPLGGM